MRFLINKDDPDQVSLAIKLSKSKPGYLVRCSQEEMEAYSKMIIIEDPEKMQLAKIIERLEERIELIEKNINVPEEVTQADVDALSGPNI